MSEVREGYIYLVCCKIKQNINLKETKEDRSYIAVPSHGGIQGEGDRNGFKVKGIFTLKRDQRKDVSFRL